MKKIKKIGIVGGSYNPVHNGHLIISEYFREQLKLDLVLLIPANISPFKVEVQSESANSQHRLNMLKIATQSNKYFKVDDYETIRSGISYSYDTVKYLSDKYLDAELFLLIGEDQAVQFNKWNKWKEILKFVNICIASRDTKGQLFTEINELFAKEGYTPNWINSPIIEISSSEIRNRIKLSKSIKYVLPTQVLNYIEKNDLYK